VPNYYILLFSFIGEEDPNGPSESENVLVTKLELDFGSYIEDPRLNGRYCRGSPNSELFA
jgi:hypothetical protein